MLHVHRRYLREFLPAMAAYVVVLLLSIWGLRHADMLENTWSWVNHRTNGGQNIRYI